MHQANGIYGFNGTYSWLSNMALVNILYEGARYSSVEHAYQAAKTLDLSERERIRACPNPFDAKKLGRKLLRVRPHWDSVKLGIMRALLLQKFKQQPFEGLLAATRGKYIEETNYWRDTYWGVYKGEGKNNLGNLIMGIRDGL